MVVPANISPGTPSDDSVVHASQDGVATNSRSHNERDISRLQSSVLPYDNTKTYKVNDVVRLLDAENFICVTAVTVPEQYAGNEIKWRPTRSDIQTGVITTSLTAVQFSTTFDVAVTQGFIVDNTDVTQPLVYLIDEPAVIGTTRITGDTVIQVYYDNTATLQQRTNDTVPVTADLDDLIIGFLNLVPAGPSVDTIAVAVTLPLPFYQTAIQGRELDILRGAMIFPGGTISKDNDVDLQLKVLAGTFYYPSFNYDTLPSQPDFADFIERSPVPFPDLVMVYNTDPTDVNSGVFAAAGTPPTGPATVDVNNYNPNDGVTSTLSAMPTGQFQIMRVYVSTTPVFVYYGWTAYESMEAALQAISNESFLEMEESKTAAFKGWIVAQEGISNWSDSTTSLFIPKPQEASHDRGMPDGSHSGLTQAQLQAALANQSTGFFTGGEVTQPTRNITTINGSGSVVTVLTSTDYNMQVGDIIRINGTVNYNGIFTVSDAVSPNQFQYVSTVNTGSESVGTTNNLSRIDIESGTGQVADQSVPGDFKVTAISWDAETNILLSGVTDTTNSIIYVSKDISENTLYTATDTNPFNSDQIRNEVLLAVIKTRQGLTGTLAETVWSIQNQRIALVNPRSQTDDFKNVLYKIESGSVVGEADPSVDFTINRTSGQIVARGLNFSNSNNSPNVLNISTLSSVSFTRVTTTGFIDGDSDVTVNLDNDNYDVNGAVVSVPSNRFTVQRLWCEPETDQYLLQYGTKDYSAGDITSRDYQNENPSTPNGLSNIAFVVASLIVKKTLTNWDADVDQEIFQGDITGGTVQAGGGGGAVSDTPWIVQHDADNFNLFDAGSIIYGNAPTVSPAITDYAVWAETNILHYNTPDTTSHNFGINGVDFVKIDQSGLTMINQGNISSTNKTVNFDRSIQTKDTNIFSDNSTQSQAATPSGIDWKINTSIFLQSFDLSSQDVLPRGIFFSPDGLKMYIIGDTNNSVYEYDLTTAWDVTTSVFLQSFSLSIENTNPIEIFFRSDGLKMYVTDATDLVFEYNLSIAWDVSTSSFVQSLNVSTQDTSPNGIFFHPNGLKMYVSGAQNDNVYEYDLTTPWDISTSTFLQSFSVLSQDTAMTSIFFRSDGLRMYMIGRANDLVYEYYLSTAWDISTTVFIQSFSVATNDNNPHSVFFKSDGLKMYVTGDQNDIVLEYDLGITVLGNATFGADITNTETDYTLNRKINGFNQIIIDGDDTDIALLELNDKTVSPIAPTSLAALSIKGTRNAGGEVEWASFDFFRKTDDDDGGLNISIRTNTNLETYLDFNNTLVDGIHVSTDISFAGILSFDNTDTSLQQSSLDLQYDVATGGTHVFRVNNGTELTLDATELNLQANNIANVSVYEFLDTATNITYNGGLMVFNVATSQDFRLRVNNAIEYVFNAGSADWMGNNLQDLGLLSFIDANTSLQQSGSDLRYDVATGGAHLMRINNVDEYRFTSFQIEMNDNNIGMLGNITFNDGKNINVDTTTGTKIGTDAAQKLGFWNVTPIVQPSHIADPTGGATIDSEARTAINSILAQLASTGLQASV